MTMMATITIRVKNSIHYHKRSSENYGVCFACRHPLSEEDKIKEQDYIPGVCCRYCRDVYTDDDRKRFFIDINKCYWLRRKAENIFLIPRNSMMMRKKTSICN
jgi:hypothetical protein